MQEPVQPIKLQLKAIITEDDDEIKVSNDALAQTETEMIGALMGAAAGAAGGGGGGGGGGGEKGETKQGTGGGAGPINVIDNSRGGDPYGLGAAGGFGGGAGLFNMMHMGQMAPMMGRSPM